MTTWSTGRQKAWSLNWLPSCSERYWIHYTIQFWTHVHRLQICCLLQPIGTKNRFWNIKIALACASAMKSTREVIVQGQKAPLTLVHFLYMENLRWRGVEGSTSKLIKSWCIIREWWLSLDYRVEQKNLAKFNDTCSVMADGLCICNPNLVGARKARNPNMQCTML